MKSYKIISIVLFLIFGFYAHSQSNVLTLDQAISEALANNANIRILNNSKDMAANMAIKGQAGLLPTVSANGSVDYGLDNTKLELANSDQTIETTGAESVNYNASVNAEFVLFNGLIGQRNFDKLQNNVLLVDAQSKKQIEEIILQVASLYYNHIRTNDNIEALNQSVEISEERYELALQQKELSGGSTLDLLNAEVDLNQDKVSLMEAELSLEQIKLQINQLLGRPLEQDIETEEVINFVQPNDYSFLLNQLKSQNSEVLEMRFAEQASVLDYKIAKSAYSPSLTLSSSYSYNRSENEGSFLLLNQTNGLGARLALNIPIYSGGTKKANEKNARIQLENSSLQLQELELSLERELMNAWKEYENSLKIVDFEEVNVLTAQTNYEYSETQFKSGQISNTDYRQAQLNLLFAQNNLNNVKFNAKLAELELLRLSGELVK